MELLNRRKVTRVDGLDCPAEDGEVIDVQEQVAVVEQVNPHLTVRDDLAGGTGLMTNPLCSK